MQDLNRVNPMGHLSKRPDAARRYSLEEKADYCRRWKASGLGKNKFCREEHISPRSLRRWLFDENLSTEVFQFLPLSSIGDDKKVFEERSSKILLHFPSGAEISFYLSDDSHLANLLKDLVS